VLAERRWVTAAISQQAQLPRTGPACLTWHWVAPRYGTPADICGQPSRRPAVVTRDRVYFALMALCIVSVVFAWTVVSRFSPTAAVVMSVAAMVIPPVAIIVVNAGDEGSRRR
jgi:Protein of unknown function (DUF3099)